MSVRLPIRGVRALLLAASALLAADAPANLTDLRRAFERPPDNARIQMRWWWFGPAVTKPELEREMRAVKVPAESREGRVALFFIASVTKQTVKRPAFGAEGWVPEGPLSDYKALNARYGERFQAQDMNLVQPQPAGLLGPVRLLAK